MTASFPAAHSTQDLRVLFFGALRQALRCREMIVTLPAGTIEQVWAVVNADRPDVAVAREHVRCARNLHFCDWNTVVQPGDEVAFMPPVCGGVGDVDAGLSVALTTDSIDVAALIAHAGADEDGAVACFIGQVRNHSGSERVDRLEYEAYRPMALASMREIGRQAQRHHRLTRVTLHHRVGELLVSDVAVVVITSAPHRADAFAGCRAIIDAVKRDVPIWKREHTPAGAVWSDARCLEDAGV
jgi:molybdopterin synthase catalytic subunit/molybdopterin converting factor small subunit